MFCKSDNLKKKINESGDINAFLKGDTDIINYKVKIHDKTFIFELDLKIIVKC